MSAEEQTRFLQELAEDLNSRSISLPSFPDVVINIRTALEDPACSAERLAEVAKTDPVLAARLLVAANSAFHNRAGIEIVNLDLAISRLGFEVVRNTAIALAVEQIFAASEYKELKDSLREIWSSSLSLASMSFVIARKSRIVNADSAFLCGLLHEIGKLYILTKARNYPALLGDQHSLDSVLADWHTSVGRSIIESWGFATEISESLESEENLSDNPNSTASLVDVVFLAKLLLSANEEAEEQKEFFSSAQKLNISPDTLPSIHDAFDQHTTSMRQSVGA